MISKERIKEFLSYTKALMDSMGLSRNRDDEYYLKYSSYKEYMRKYNDLLKLVIKEVKIGDLPVDYCILDNVPGKMDTIALQQKEFFDTTFTNLSILRAYLENMLDLKKEDIENLKYFLSSNLRKAIFNNPEKEKDIQDAIESLLIGKGLEKGIDYDRETGRVKFSNKEFVPDFVFHKLDLILEVKLSKDKARIRVIVDEINADIMAYKKEFSNQLFLIYDLGSIRDESEFRNDLDNIENISLIIVKH